MPGTSATASPFITWHVDVPMMATIWPGSTALAAGAVTCASTLPTATAMPSGRPVQAAAWTGLPEGIAGAVGNVDAHVTAPAACAVEPGQMVAIMGTSTCHVMNGDAVAE